MVIEEAKNVREITYKIIFSSIFLESIESIKCVNFWNLEDNTLKYNKESIIDYINEEYEMSSECISFIFSNLDYYILNKDNFSEIISHHLKSNYTLDRLAKSDLAIIYEAMIELQRNTSLSEKIIINEAVELSKKYSSDNAYKFINGILSNIVKEIRE